MTSPAKEVTVAELERESAEPDFWSDHQQAQRKMQQMGRLRDTLSLWREFESRCRDLIELTDLAIEENELSIQEELETGAAELGLELAREEIKLTLSGPYDERSAIVTIHSGGRRHGLAGLGRNAAADVRGMGRVREASRGGDGPLLWRRGRPAQRNAGSGRQPCFRLSERRAGRAPACPAVAIRPQQPAAHFLRQRGNYPGG